MKVEAKLNGDYDYSSTQFNLPPQIAKKIIDWGKENIPDENLYHDKDGGKGREDEIHCTLLYGIHAEESPDILELVKEPIEVELGRIEKFDNDDYDVIKVTVLDKSGKLEELWNGIKDAEEYTSDYDKKFEPHVTIAYVKKGSCDDIIDSDPFAGDIVVLDNFKFSSTDKSKTQFKKLSIKRLSSYSDEDESQILEEVEDLIKKEFTDREIVRYLKEAFNLDSEDAYWFINAVQRSLNEPNELQQIVKDKEEKSSRAYLQTKAVSYGSTSYGSRIESLKEYPVYLKYLGEPDELENHYLIGNWLLVIEGTPARYYLGQLLDYARGEKGKLVIDGGTNWTIHNMDKVVEEAYGLAKYLNPEMKKQSVKQMFTLQIGNATDMMRAIQALDELQNVRLNYTVSGSALLFGKQEDLNDARTLLKNNGILALEKKASKEHNRGDEITTVDGYTGKVVKKRYHYESPDCLIGYDVEFDDSRKGKQFVKTDQIKIAISKDHITEDLGRFDTIKEDAQNIEKNVDELKEDDNKLLKQASIDLDGIYFRGCSLKEAMESCKAGTLVYYSSDPMSMDWEVIEYGLGDSANDLSDVELGAYVKNIVPWKDIRKGVNLTNDLSNAEGYGDVVLGVSIEGNFAEFSDVHFFAENPKDCKVKVVFYEGKELLPEEFLNTIMKKSSNINIEKSIALNVFNRYNKAWKDILQMPNSNSVIDVYIKDEIEKMPEDDYIDNDIVRDYLISLLRKFKKTMSIKKYNFFTGEDEPVEVESEVIAVVDGMGEDDVETGVEECACEQIDPNQSKGEIASQLMDTFISKYPKAKTYQNIFNCAKECGLIDSMDKYDAINIMNAVATDVGLPRQGFDEFFPEDEITESADIRGTSGAPEFNEDGDMEGALQEFKESFDNVAESLYEIDRVLEERYRMLYDGEKLVDESKDIVREALRKVKKEAIVKKYFMSDFKVKQLDRTGRCVEGKLIYKVQMTQAGKINRTIEVELPIKSNQVQSPNEFSYKNEKFPLATYYINDVFDR